MDHGAACMVPGLTTHIMKTTVAICGAGIAGVATAYYLVQHTRDTEVLLIDKNQPLSFTTSKSGENYRDYWPEECMRQFISHSIALMKELREAYGDQSFQMVESGYNFISHIKQKSLFGSPFDNPDSIVEVIDSQCIQKEFPYLDKEVKKVVRIKNAGKIDVYALGSLLLREAKKLGMVEVTGEIVSIEKKGSRFQLTLESQRIIGADKVVIATGPFINGIAKMLGFRFPVHNTLQRKFTIPDPLKIIPETMPFTIYADPQYLDWSAAESDFFRSEKKYGWLLQEFPGGLHVKPDSGGIKLGWAFQTGHVQPQWESPPMEFFPQVVLKGASRFIPALEEYENDIPSPLVEYAGYYTRTRENWPLIGPTPINNVYVIGALAGFGTMAACAAGKLCAAYALNESGLPPYAPFFHPLRYQHTEIVNAMEKVISDGQL